MSESLRLFFAIPVPPTQARNIQDWRRQLPCAGNWVHEHDLHLTLAFLGQQATTRLAELRAAADQTKRHRAFELRLDRLDIWNDGLLHLAPSRPPMALLQLQRTLAEQLQRCGFTLEQRTYRPHLTLARHATVPTSPAAFSFAWHVDQFALFSSNSAMIGPRYQQIGTWPLA